MNKNLDIIIYSNYFELENRVFAFRKKHLFDITNLPTLVNLKNNNNCLGYWISRKWFTLSKLKPLIKKKEKIVDVSDLQWYQQIELDCVFNLN
jgi:plasmid rolling circle replication initiator protein Rep